MIAKVSTLYKKKKEKLRHAQYNEIEETVGLQKDGELEIHDDSTNDDKESNSSASDFETDEGDEEVRSPETKAKLSHSIADIYNQAFEDIKDAVRGFEEWGSYEEEPADSDNEYDSDIEKNKDESKDNNKDNEQISKSQCSHVMTNC